MVRRLVVISMLIMLISIMSTVTGCWSRREIETLAIASGVGVDRVEVDGKRMYRFTVQVVKPGQLAGGEAGGGRGGGGGQKPYLVASTLGKTIWEAERNFTTQTSRKLFLSHTQVVIIGEKLAREGIQPVLDFIQRKHDFRETTLLLVAMGPADTTLMAAAGLEKVTAREISDMVVNTRRASVSFPLVTREAISMIQSSGSETILPRVIHIPYGHKGTPTGLRLNGAAVFKKDKLVGWLTPEETRGWMWVTKRVVSGVVPIPVPGKPGENRISTEISRATASITPSIKNGRLVIKVKINEEGGVGEIPAPGLDPAEPEVVQQMEQFLAEAIRREVLAALRRAQEEYRSDIFGFGDTVHRAYPKVWKKMEKRWNEEFFPNLEVRVEVEARIRRVGMSGKALSPK